MTANVKFIAGIAFVLAAGRAAQVGSGLVIAYALAACGMFLVILAMMEVSE
jgi:hypothetical protein